MLRNGFGYLSVCVCVCVCVCVRERERERERERKEEVRFNIIQIIFPSIRVFSNESVLRIRWPKSWSFSFSASPSNEYSRLISFRMDWLDLLAVQGSLKSLLQHHSSKASILQPSTFFVLQLSHPHMTTGKTTVLARRTFVGKVMSLLLTCCLGWSKLFFRGASIF